MRHLIFILTAFVLFACTQKPSNSSLLKYTESINNQSLDKKVIETYISGMEKSVVYFEKGQSDSNPVKEVHLYEDGTIQAEGTLKDKKRHGVWSFYHKNGNTWSTGTFENGKSVGCFKIYKPDGSLKIKSYYEKGNKVKEEYFKDDKLVETIDIQKSSTI